MDSTLRWYAQFIHVEHKHANPVEHWSDCDAWPCYHLKQSVLKGRPVYVETDGAGAY